MKIGIITHHYVKNYGAYLQAYALINRIKQIHPNAEVEIVDKVVKKHYLLNVYRRFKFSTNRAERKTYLQKFKQFNTLTKYEHSLPTSKGYSKKRVANNYDKIIIGSDEVWNFLDYSYDPIKFGYGLDGVKVYTYAASAGEVLTTTLMPKEVKAGMKNLKMIGVRDNNTKKLAERALEKKSTVVLDPTLIYDYDKELENVNTPSIDGKYILVYGCKFNEAQKDAILKFAKDNNLKIIGAGEYKEWYYEAQIDLTPFEWVNLYRNAEVVLTGTFHGLMFSLKYNKNFVCLPVFQNRINKTRTILEEVELMDRLILDGNAIEELVALMSKSIEYENAKRILKNRRSESETFLKAVLED